MPTKLVTETSIIKKYDIHEKIGSFGTDANYIICGADVLDSKYENELTEKGFRFLDRILYMEISLAKRDEDKFVYPKLKSLDSEIDFTVDEIFTDSMYQIAYMAYTSDRRFHLNPVFCRQEAMPVIKAYMDECRSKHMKIYKASHRGELLGFTIVDEAADKKQIYFENVLGVTIPGIKGKMIAEDLYISMLLGEGKSFKKYVGRVSASNAASINLHTRLGAKVGFVYDEFIYKTASPGSDVI